MPLVSENIKKIQNKIFEPKPYDFKDPKKAQKAFTNLDFVGYKGLTRDVHSYLAMKNGWFSQLVLMRGHGVKNLTSGLSNELVKDAGDFFKSLPQGTNISFFAYSFRVNTQPQQAAWQRTKKQVEMELKATNDERKIRQLKRRLVMINEELKMQKRVEMRLWNREYLMEVFGRTKGALENIMRTVKTSSEHGTGPFRFDELTVEQKLQRLYTLNNPAGYLAEKD